MRQRSAGHTPFSKAMACKMKSSGGCRKTGIFTASSHRGTPALPDRFDVPLRYLGDWHKQPGSMIQPSHGDLMTALSWLDDDELGMDYLLVPIVTVGHARIIGESELSVNYITVPMDNGTDMRVDWWYIHRDVRVFQPVHPQITEEEELPQMMKYAWHVVLPDRLTSETLAMADDGLLVRTLFYECDGRSAARVLLFHHTTRRQLFPSVCYAARLSAIHPQWHTKRSFCRRARLDGSGG